MKTIFIINPKAGQKKDAEKVKSEIVERTQNLDCEIEIYITSRRGDAGRFVREYLEKCPEGRFIACGGDGTFGEVVNGAMGFEKAEVGVIPMGTGNDFCRNFPCREKFLDVGAQIKGKTTKCDVIRYTTEVDGKETLGYCANMFNIGFDCNVGDMTGRMKKKPFISGSFAYFLSILVMLIKKKGANIKLELDGTEIHQGPLLLTSVANGSFCGGGIKSNPAANVNDGLMDVNVVKNISRLTFIGVLPFYMKGTHTTLKNVERIITTHKCKKITLTPLDGKIRLCVDGEICDAEKTEFEIIHEGFNFVLPSECE